MRRAPVFQMSLGMTSEHRVGWLLSDEISEEEGVRSIAFTVPWRPDAGFDQMEYVLYGDRHGRLIEFPLRFNGHLFVNKQTRTRFSLADPMAPDDFRGLPFLRPFPYLGAHQDTLQAYELRRDFLSFLPLTPLDLIRMDELYLRERIIFVGVTRSFGPHTTAAFHSSPWNEFHVAN